MKNERNRGGRVFSVCRAWIVFPFLVIFLLSYGAGFHRHGHIPLSNHMSNESHTHQADFHVVIVSDDYEGDPGDKWAQVDVVESGMAKKSLDHADSLVFFLCVIVLSLRVRGFILWSANYCLSHRPLLRYAVPALRGPPA